MGFCIKLSGIVATTCLIFLFCIALMQFHYYKTEAFKELTVRIKYAKNFAESETCVDHSVRASVGHYAQVCSDTERTLKIDPEAKSFQMALDKSFGFVYEDVQGLITKLAVVADNRNGDLHASFSSRFPRQI